MLRGSIRNMIPGFSMALLVMLTTNSMADPSAESSFVPEWGTSVGSVPANHSFFNVQYLGPDVQARENFRNGVLNPRTVLEIRQQYDDMTRDYRMRENYDLNNEIDHRSYMERVNGFTLYVLRHVFSYQLSEGMKKAEKNSEEVRTFSQVQRSVEKVAKGTVDLDVADHFKLGTRANFPRQEGQIWVSSSVVSGQVDMTFGQPWGYDPFTFSQMSDAEPSESYRISLSRHIPLVNLSSGLSYGGSTTRMTASLSKQLSSHLTAVFAATRGLDTEKAGLVEGKEETLSLHYGISF